MLYALTQLTGFRYFSRHDRQFPNFSNRVHTSYCHMMVHCHFTIYRYLIHNSSFSHQEICEYIGTLFCILHVAKDDQAATTDLDLQRPLTQNCLCIPHTFVLFCPYCIVLKLYDFQRHFQNKFIQRLWQRIEKDHAGIISKFLPFDMAWPHLIDTVDFNAIFELTL